MLKYVIIFVLAIGIGAVILGIYTLYTFSSLPDNPVWRLILKREFKAALTLFKLRRQVVKLDKLIFEVELKFIMADAYDFSDQRYINIALYEAWLANLKTLKIIVNQNIYFCNIPLLPFV